MVGIFFRTELLLILEICIQTKEPTCFYIIIRCILNQLLPFILTVVPFFADFLKVELNDLFTVFVTHFKVERIKDQLERKFKLFWSTSKKFPKVFFYPSNYKITKKYET